MVIYKYSYINSFLQATEDLSYSYRSPSHRAVTHLLNAFKGWHLTFLMKSRHFDYSTVPADDGQMVFIKIPKRTLCIEHNENLK